MSDVFGQTAPVPGSPTYRREMAAAAKQRAYPNLNRGSRTNTPRAGDFVEELFKTNGQVVEAMKATGIQRFNPRQLLNSPAVLKAIARRQALMENPGGITPEDVMENLLRIGDAAEEAGQYAPAIKAQELIGKQIGMFIERSINVNVDGNRAHLAALKAMMDVRKAKMIGHASLVPAPPPSDPFADL